MSRTARPVAALLVAAVLWGASPAAAQEPEPLFSRTDAAWAGGFILAAAALAPLDVALARELQDPDRQANQVLRFGAGGLRVLGWPGSLLVTGGMYAGGRIAGADGLAAAGLHATEAIIVAEAFTFLGKGIVGRARPHRDPEKPFDVALFRGLRSDDFQAFPSGHTSAAFATASALTAEVGYRRPELKTPVGIVLYSAATLVGVSRMYHNEHWASDVVIGAAIGTFAGWKVVRYHHTRPENPVDRIFLARVVPTGSGVAVVIGF